MGVSEGVLRTFGTPGLICFVSRQNEKKKIKGEDRPEFKAATPYMV